MELLTFFDKENYFVYDLIFEKYTPYIAAASFTINEEAIRGIRRVLGTIYSNLKCTSYLLVRKHDGELNVIGHRLIVVLNISEEHSVDDGIEEMMKNLGLLENLGLMGIPLENNANDVLDFTNEIFMHVDKTIKDRGHMQLLDNIKRGKEYGYPDCCILEFVENMIKMFSGIPNVKPKDFKLKGTGFVPCTSCNNLKSEDMLVAEINAKRNTLKHGYFSKDMR